MTTWRIWSDEMVSGIAAGIRRRRSDLGLTAAEVSERTAMGKPLSRAVISDLETGRKRTLDVAELVTVAYALEVSPLSLLMPDALADVEVFPGVTVPGIDVFGWWTGVGGVTDTSTRDLLGKDDGVRTAFQLVEVEKTLRLLRSALQSAERAYLMSENDSDRDRAEHVRNRIGAFEAERGRLLDAYRSGVTDEDPPDA